MGEPISLPVSARSHGKGDQVARDKELKDSIPLPWGLIGAIKDGGIVIALIWYLWFTQTETIPSTQREFHRAIEAERGTYTTELRNQRVHDEKRNADLAGAVKEVGKEVVGELRKLRKVD